MTGLLKLELEIVFVGAGVAGVAPVTPGAALIVAPLVVGCDAAGSAAGCTPLDSSSSTRLSSCSTRSSRYCSLAVSPDLRVSNLTGDVAPEGLPSSAKTPPGAIVTQRIVTRHNRVNLIFESVTGIFLSLGS